MINLSYPSCFLFGQHQERPDICAWHEGTPADEIETWLSIYMFAEALSKVFDRGKRPVFFFLSSVPCVGEESVLMGLHWLPAGQRATRVDFKTHSDTFKFFIARLPYNYVLIREPLSYYRPGKNLFSLQTLIDHIVFLTLKFMSIVPFPLLLQNC